jgi:hypothetical protein
LRRAWAAIRRIAPLTRCKRDSHSAWSARCRALQHLLKYCAHAPCSHCSATVSALLPFLQSARGYTALRARVVKGSTCPACRRLRRHQRAAGPRPNSRSWRRSAGGSNRACTAAINVARWPDRFKAARAHLFCAFASAPAPTSSRATCRRPSPAAKSPQCSGKCVSLDNSSDALEGGQERVAGSRLLLLLLLVAAACGVTQWALRTRTGRCQRSRRRWQRKRCCAPARRRLPGGCLSLHSEEGSSRG